MLHKLQCFFQLMAATTTWARTARMAKKIEKIERQKGSSTIKEEVGEIVELLIEDRRHFVIVIRSGTVFLKQLSKNNSSCVPNIFRRNSFPICKHGILRQEILLFRVCC